MRNRTTIAVLVALAFAAIAGITVAQSEPGTPPEGKPIVQDGQRVTGTVISSEANRLTVKAENGQEMVFIVNEQTAEPHLFNVGDRVTAQYATIAGTGYVVSRVVSVPAPTVTTTTTYVPPASQTKVSTTAPAPAAAPAPVRPMAPETTATTTTTVTPTTANTYDTTDDASVDTLPATASSLPIVALLGLFAAGGAIVIHRMRQ
jgi:hypothetical protein